MCDIALERERIDAILEQATAGTVTDDDTVAEAALAALREHYIGTCSEECMRARCEDFVARLRRLRRMSDGVGLECGWINRCVGAAEAGSA